LAAIEAGVTMVDATAFGMGRGAGNLPMELLLAHLESQGHQGVRAAPYMNLVAQRYEPLQAELGWGYGVAPMLGGLAGLHPSAVSRSLAECGGGPGVLWETLFALGDLRHLSVQPVGDQPCVR
ncbi:MAG: hypothetical protein VKQ33_15570, partial [Candidatus Sericytochromatia bacterium]|nr:hypothetical protein [Candidatus Sericytochromatia bacterium]